MREFRRLSRWFSGAPLIAAAVGDTWTDGRVGPKGAKNALRNVPQCHKADASYEEEVERRKMGADSIK